MFKLEVLLLDNLDLGELLTETININTKNIDNVSTIDMVKMFNSEDKKVPKEIEKNLDKIAEAIDVIYEKIKKGGRLIYIGAGSSGRLGILDASECPPTYGVSDELVQGLIAGGKDAMFKAKEGAEDSYDLAVEDLINKNLSSKDIVVGIAASGRTPYVIGGLKYANKVGAFTISLSCNQNSKISELSKIDISILVGPEVITGSTRLKSGTAQKLVLNMLSTGTMIKLGKVYGNLMVDIKATNEKLIERAKNIVCEATGITRNIAEDVLLKTNYDVKLAIFMIISGLEIEESRKKLEKHGGYIAKSLKDI